MAYRECVPLDSFTYKQVDEIERLAEKASVKVRRQYGTTGGVTGIGFGVGNDIPMGGCVEDYDEMCKWLNERITNHKGESDV